MFPKEPDPSGGQSSNFFATRFELLNHYFTDPEKWTDTEMKRWLEAVRGHVMLSIYSSLTGSAWLHAEQ